MTRPSLADFGTHDESAYPELWHGVIGSWCPSLGPTGSRLHDFSRRNNWGTFVNIGPDRWIVQDGLYSLNFVASNNQSIQVESSQNQLSTPSTSVSISVWCRPTANGSNPGRDIVGKSYAGTPPYISYGMQFHSASIYNAFSFAIGTGTAADSDYAFVESQSSALNAIYHACGTFDGSVMRIYLNGQLSGTRTDSRPMIFNTQPLAIGRWLGSDNPNDSFVGQIYQIIVRPFAMRPNQVALEYQIGPGGMYTRRTRRSFYIPAGFNASWARNSNVLLGAGATC